MDEYGNIKAGQFKNDPLSLAMSVFPPRPMSGATNPFQNPSVSSAYGFNMDGTLGHAPSLYNPPPSHLPNTTKMGSRLPDAETRQMNHSFTKPPSVIYHNFTPLNSCNIVTTNGFFSINSQSEMSKHFEDLLNLPANFHTDSPMNAQMIMPKTQFHEPIATALTDNRHYSQESLNSYVQNLNAVSQEIHMTESKKHSRNQKVQSKSAVAVNSMSVNSIQTSQAADNSSLDNEAVNDDVVNNSVCDAAHSNDILSTAYSGRSIYRCGFCELKVSSTEALLSHLNTHTSSFSYCCSICGAAFVEGSQLVKHVQQSHVVKLPYACGLCTSAFHQNEELEKHIESHDELVSINKTRLPLDPLVKEKKKTTEDVNMKEEESEPEEEAEDEVGVENSDQSAFHLNPTSNTIIIGKDTNFSMRKGPSKILMDDIDLNSVCTVIVEPSSAGGIRKKHLFRCNYCEKVCKDKGSLVSHVRTHTKGRPYECSICFAKFKQYAHLSDHIMTKHTKDRPFVCDRCAKTFNRKSHLQDHIRLRHTEDKLYHCSECSAVFQKRTDFSEHKRTHGKPPKYQCNMCPRQFRNVTDYERHIRSHTKEKRYECEVCHLTFGLLANAKKHMIKHNEERPFKCEICPKAYHFEHDFKRHKLTHLKKKPFPCPDCYKSFKNAVLLKKHAKETHMKSEEDPSKKPFKCLTCRKRFRIQWDLDRHRKIHAKKKPFPCLYCYKSYGSEAMLAKHAKVHEGQDLPLYDHSKDLIEDPDKISDKKKRGRKPGFKVESESLDLEEETEVDEKPKRRGRPPKQKREFDGDKISVVKLRKRLPRKRSESESDGKPAPSIKVTFRRSKLRKRKFPCPECDKVFMSKSVLERHSRMHDNDSEDSNESPSENESTNEASDVMVVYNENANDASSLKESADDDTNYHLGDDSTGDGDRSKDDDATRDDDNTWDHSSISDDDDESSREEMTSPNIRTQKSMAHFSQLSNSGNIENSFPRIKTVHVRLPQRSCATKLAK